MKYYATWSYNSLHWLIWHLKPILITVLNCHSAVSPSLSFPPTRFLLYACYSHSPHHPNHTYLCTLLAPFRTQTPDRFPHSCQIFQHCLWTDSLLLAPTTSFPSNSVKCWFVLMIIKYCLELLLLFIVLQLGLYLTRYINTYSNMWYALCGIFY